MLGCNFFAQTCTLIEVSLLIFDAFFGKTGISSRPMQRVDSFQSLVMVVLSNAFLTVQLDSFFS